MNKQIMLEIYKLNNILYIHGIPRYTITEKNGSKVDLSKVRVKGYKFSHKAARIKGVELIDYFIFDKE